MAPDRRNQLLLVALALALGLLVYRLLPPTTATTPSSGAAAAPSRDVSSTASARREAPDVHLAALGSDRPKPTETDRNLFRFKSKQAPVTIVQKAPPVAAAPPVPAGPPPPPATPPITLKFIGIVEARERSLKVAVLSDAFGVYYGREGETVLGQYKILRIGAESLEIAYLDGRGRQTIRLSGS
jgi:hypothetical protein